MKNESTSYRVVWGLGDKEEIEAKNRRRRQEKFIRDIPKTFVTREDYDQMVLVVNKLVEKVNQLPPATPPPPQKK